MSQLGMFSEELAPIPAQLLRPSRAVRAIDEALRAEFPAKVRAFVLGHLSEHGPTSGEDLVDGMLLASIQPGRGDGRAYGPAIQALSQQALIEPYGVGHRRKGNGTLGAVIWRITAKGLAQCP